MNVKGLIQRIWLLQGVNNTSVFVEFTFGEGAEHSNVNDVTLAEIRNLERSWSLNLFLI